MCIYVCVYKNMTQEYFEKYYFLAKTDYRLIVNSTFLILEILLTWEGFGSDVELMERCPLW